MNTLLKVKDFFVFLFAFCQCWNKEREQSVHIISSHDLSWSRSIAGTRPSTRLRNTGLAPLSGLSSEAPTANLYFQLAISVL